MRIDQLLESTLEVVDNMNLFVGSEIKKSGKDTYKLGERLSTSKEEDLAMLKTYRVAVNKILMDNLESYRTKKPSKFNPELYNKFYDFVNTIDKYMWILEEKVPCIDLVPNDKSTLLEYEELVEESDRLQELYN